MDTWTPGDWTTFFVALGAFVTTAGGVAATIILQLRGNAKTEASKQISADNNEKINAVVAQTREIASAVPGASTAPTDAVTGPAKP